jgi:ABC-type multidrug transport system fused ATPase/permease subunit
MSVDVERIVKQCEPFHLLYSSVIMILIGFVILYNTVGVSFVTTIIMAILFFASLPVLTRRVPHRQKDWSRCTDLRVKLFNSAVRNMKAVKMSGYEDIMIEKLQALREVEVVKQILFFKDLLVVSAGT